MHVEAWQNHEEWRLWWGRNWCAGILSRRGNSIKDALGQKNCEMLAWQLRQNPSRAGLLYLQYRARVGSVETDLSLPPHHHPRPYPPAGEVETMDPWQNSCVPTFLHFWPQNVLELNGSFTYFCRGKCRSDYAGTCFVCCPCGRNYQGKLFPSELCLKGKRCSSCLWLYTWLK